MSATVTALRMLPRSRAALLLLAMMIILAAAAIAAAAFHGAPVHGIPGAMSYSTSPKMSYS
jgi:hypothetical protein